MTTFNLKNSIPSDDCFIKSGPDLNRDIEKVNENPSYILYVSCYKGKDDCRDHAKRNLSISKPSKSERIAFSLMKRRFYASLIPLLVGFICWMLEGFLLPPFKSSHIIIAMKDTIFAAYSHYIYFLLMMGATSIVLKLYELIKTLLLKSSKHESASVLELAGESDTETCSRDNIKAQKISKKIGWFLLHSSLIFCLYYFIGSWAPSLSFHIKPSSHLLFSVPSASELLKFPKIDQKPLRYEPIDHTFQNAILSPEDDQEKQMDLPMSRILGKLNLPHAESLIVCQNRSVVFVSVSQPAGMVKIVTVSDPENPQVLRSIHLNKTSEPPLKSLALSPDNKTLVASNMISTEIVDVTDLFNPQVRGYAECPEKLRSRILNLKDKSFRVSIAFSDDGNAVFIAGMGLLGYDISNKSAPKILSGLEDFQEEEPLMSSVSIQDKILYVANGPLKRYDISSLTHIRSLPPLATKTQVNSLVIHQQNETTKKLFVIGRSNQGVILEEFNISDSASPNETKSFKLDMDAPQVPFLFAVTKSGENLFITSDSHDLHIFNFAQEKCIYRNFENLIKPINSLTISQGGHQVFVIANELLIIYKLYKDYPNQRIFSQTNNTIGSYPTGYPGHFMSLISNDQILILATSKCRVKSFVNSDSCQGDEAAIETFNVSNPAFPSNISTYPLPAGLKAFMVFPDQNKTYVTQETGVQILNLSNNSLSLISYFPVEKGAAIKNSVFTPDGKIGFLYKNVSDQFKLEIYDFSTFKNITRLGSMNLTSDLSSFDILLSNDTKTIFLIGTNTTRIDVSDPHEPRQINSFPIVSDGEGYGYAGFLAQNPIDKSENLFIKVRDSNEDSNSLQLYNVSNVEATVNSPYILPDFPLLQSNDTFYTSIVPSPLHSDLIYLASNNGKGESLLVINISNATKPVLQGTVPVLEESRGEIMSLVLSNDGSTAYISTKTFGLQIIQLKISHTLFLESEIFKLGPKVSTKVKMLELNNENEYIIMDSDDFKIQEVSLFDLKIPSFSESVKFSYVQFPYWMSFDKYKSEFILHPQREKDIGIYGLHSVYSTKVNASAFSKIISIGENDTLCQDLIDSLISFDYLDNRYFLTSKFDKQEDFVLSSRYRNLTTKIYNILKQFRFETYTTFEILPSLQITFEENKTHIQTPSEDDLRVDILLQSESGAQFLSKHYGLLQPVVEKDSTEIILDGSSKQINAALEELVINLKDNSKDWNATITVDDHLNPSQTLSITNISRFFQYNSDPILKVTDVQAYIDSQPPIYVGSYFSIPLDRIFCDNHSRSLSYELLKNKEGDHQLPSWLIFHEKGIQGTPPDDMNGDQIELRLIAKNEFRSNEVIFALKVKWGKWVAAKNSLNWIMENVEKKSAVISPILAAIVAILWRRKNKCQEFFVDIGQEITKKIPPTFFAQSEKSDSELILKYIRGKIAREQLRREISNLQVASYFVNQNGQLKTKEEIISIIHEVVTSEILQNTHQLHLYMDDHYRQKFTKQLVFNQIVLWRVESPEEEATRRVFDAIKRECVQLIDWDLDLDFKWTVNSQRRNELLRDRNLEIFGDQFRNALEEPLIHPEENNRYYLLDALIEAEALEQQILNFKDPECKIGVEKKIQMNFLTQVKEMNVSGLFNLENFDYGIKYKVKRGVLLFSGVPGPTFENKTIVVQIKTGKFSIKELRNKVIREIVIHGVANGPQNYRVFIDEEAEDRPPL